MSFLIADQERYPLRPGRNTVGGRGTDAVALTALAGLAPAAVITVRPDGTALIQRIAAAVIVKVDGGPLGAMPHPLTDGARVSIGPVRLTYASAPAEPESHAPASKPLGSSEKPTTPTEVIEILALPPVVGGRLIELGTGCVYPVPRDGVVIGRGAECDISVDDPGVSRRHAVVKPGRGGFVVTDESANGTFVNGARMVGMQTLQHGDVVGIGTEEYRVDVDAGPFSAVFQPSNAQVELIGGVPEPDPLSLISSRRTAPPPPPVSVHSHAPPTHTPVPPVTALAHLEVIRGPIAHKVFRIERQVCAIGRGDQNDVRLNDPSVSSSHATLLLKRGTWYVVDLQSANGTYVDGYRVATERALPDGGSLRIGEVVLKFRILAAPRESPSATRGGGGIWRRISRLWSGV